MKKACSANAELMAGNRFKQSHQRSMLVVAILLVMVIVATIGLTIYNYSKLEAILENSIEPELFAALIAEHRTTALVGVASLVLVVVVTLGLLFAFLIILLRRNQKMGEHLYRMSNYDPITGLLNRNFFFRYFSEWSKKRPQTGVAFAIEFIDLDNFKNVNDQAGHDAGDELLKLIADFFCEHATLETNDAGIDSIVARIGGDEFLIVLPGISTAEELEAHARSMLEGFSLDEKLKPFIENYAIGLSIGGSLYPSQAEDYDELVKLADIAMYKAKFAGKNKYALYDESMGEGTEDMILTVRVRKKD